MLSISPRQNRRVSLPIMILAGMLGIGSQAAFADTVTPTEAEKLDSFRHFADGMWDVQMKSDEGVIVDQFKTCLPGDALENYLEATLIYKNSGCPLLEKEITEEDITLRYQLTKACANRAMEHYYLPFPEGEIELAFSKLGDNHYRYVTDIRANDETELNGSERIIYEFDYLDHCNRFAPTGLFTPPDGKWSYWQQTDDLTNESILELSGDEVNARLLRYHDRTQIPCERRFYLIEEEEYRVNYLIDNSCINDVAPDLKEELGLELMENIPFYTDISVSELFPDAYQIRVNNLDLNSAEKCQNRVIEYRKVAEMADGKIPSKSALDEANCPQEPMGLKGGGVHPSELKEEMAGKLSDALEKSLNERED